MTGELKSGKLRYVKLYLNQRINGEKLRFFQDNPQVMKHFFSELIMYLEIHYVGVVSFFKNEFEEYRKKFAQLQEPRLIETAVHLSMSNRVVIQFLLDNRAVDEYKAEKLSRTFNQALFKVLAKQSEEVKTVEPYKCIS